MSYTEKHQSIDYATGLQRESLDSSNLNNSSFSHYSHNKMDLLPTCNKISSFLNDFGYTTVQLVPTDINTEFKYVQLICVNDNFLTFCFTVLYPFLFLNRGPVQYSHP